MQAVTDQDKRNRQQRGNLHPSIPQKSSSKTKIANITAIDPTYGTELNVHQNSGSANTQQ
jgi:hypothetical protein